MLSHVCLLLLLLLLLIFTEISRKTEYYFQVLPFKSCVRNMKQIASSLWKCSVETQVSASFCKSLKFGVPQGNKYPLILRSLNLTSSVEKCLRVRTGNGT